MTPRHAGWRARVGVVRYRSQHPVIIENPARAIVAAAKELHVKGRLRVVHKGAHYFLVAMVHAPTPIVGT